MGCLTNDGGSSPETGATPLFSIAGVPVAVTICEDAWSPDGPIARQAAGGAELVVSLNASPFRAGIADDTRGCWRHVPQTPLLRSST